jgi:hypothetical protein
MKIRGMQSTILGADLVHNCFTLSSETPFLLTVMITLCLTDSSVYFSGPLSNHIIVRLVKTKENLKATIKVYKVNFN